MAGKSTGFGGGDELVNRWAAEIAAAGHRFAIPPQWIRAVMRMESAGVPSATSPAGAMGLLQIMPATWAGLRRRYDLGADPYEPRDNILAGVAYMRELLNRYGSTSFLAAYNAGPERLDDHLLTGRPLPDETRRYLAMVGPQLVADPSSHAAMGAPLPILGEIRARDLAAQKPIEPPSTSCYSCSRRTPPLQPGCIRPAMTAQPVCSAAARERGCSLHCARVGAAHDRSTTKRAVRKIGGDLRWRRVVQTGARRTARLKAVPSAAWLGVGAVVLLGSRQCRAFCSVPTSAANRPFAWRCWARWASWPGSSAQET